MAFSFRQIISNIPYFKKDGEDGCGSAGESPNTRSGDKSLKSKTNGSVIDPAKNSDNHNGKKCNKNLKINIEKAKSIESSMSIVNTPQKLTLLNHNSETFSERLKEFDLNRSFDVYELMNENFDIQSMSDHSEHSEISDTEVKMCRKVELKHSSSTESFTDVDEKTEEERTILIQSYQTRFEKYEAHLHELLKELQFHIEVSKVFNTKAITTFPQKLSDDKPGSPWNTVTEKEDLLNKYKIRKQLVSLKQLVESFLSVYLQRSKSVEREETRHKHVKINKKKLYKNLETFPDYGESFHNLFRTEALDESIGKCNCNCHFNESQTDSGLSKDTNQSISSSLGNFSLGSTTLTNFSESLDHIISYTSYNSCFYTSIIQKTAMERIKFYVKVHGIEVSDTDLDESRMNFKCHSCSLIVDSEIDLLKHVLSQKHCEKIHFLYKTAYIKKCVQDGKEILPSTVLNSMVYYRDRNKVVCFGDNVYACSLCFELDIIGESILIEHCNSLEHLERKEGLVEFLQ